MKIKNNPFGFIHHGAKVFWDDPAADDYGPEKEKHLKTVYVVHSVNGKAKSKAEENDDIVLIYDRDGCSEAEVYAGELRPWRPDTPSNIDVLKADAFLLSCIKHADSRMRKAEKRAISAETALQELQKASGEERASIKKERINQEQKERISALSGELGQLRKDLEFYRCSYLSEKNPVGRPLSSFGKDGFANTPDHIGRFLARCPLREQQAADPDVRVVVETEDGECLPVTGIWYDNLNGTVRITF